MAAKMMGSNITQNKNRPVRRGLIWVILVVAVMLVVAYFAIGAYVATQLTKVSRQSQKATPADYSLAFENTRFPSRDGLQLVGWFIPAPGSQRVLVMVHGRNSCRSCEFNGKFVEAAAKFQKAGYNVLLFDLRGHGESQGSHFTMGAEERWDVLGAVDWLQQRGFTQIAVLGASLGAGSAVEAAADPQGGQGIKALVLDSCYSDLPNLLRAKFTAETGLPDFLIAGSLEMEKLLQHVDMAAIKPAVELHRINTPLFLIFGDQDDQVPRAQYWDNVAARPDAETWLLENVSHVGAYPHNPDAYVARVVAFLDKNLR
ncbi:MAG: alpha/beta fold hydrolase [Chloroflexi bacterium]|nr:alpha/beta fold hydrolase [Chloroflexota bacterium]